MNVWSALQHYPVEAVLYEIGFLLLAVSLMWYSSILRRMLKIIHERAIWLFPLLGAVFILLSVGMHAYAYLVLMPRLDWMRTVEEINTMTTYLLQWRMWALTSILLGGICSLLGGALYYRWTTR